MRKILFIITALMLLFTSCEEMFISDVKAPPSEAKVVVMSFISPDQDTLRVHLSRSMAYFAMQSDDRRISNAVVTLKGNNAEVTLPYSPENRAYEIPAAAFAIVPGQKYELQISLEGKSVTAETTVPKRAVPGPEDVKIETEKAEKAISFTIQDPPGAGDYYHISTLGIHRNSMGTVYTIPDIRSGQPYFSDKVFDGEKFSLSYQKIYVEPGFETNFYVDVAITDANYYLFWRSLGNDTENPFSEPTPVYSNVTGGIGVFGSFIRERFEIKE